MTTVLCTLYNSLYLDKGLVLYDSLCECAKDFKLYVLCMDDKCYEVLTDLNQKHHIPVRLADFEAGDEALLKAKGNRSMGEYCWTCSSSFIRYVLNHYKEDSCTYIDADMAFYNDPQILIDEMMEAKKSVMVVPHRFPEDKKDLAKTVGTYCVEFNTFLNTAYGLEALEYWRNRCLECCSNLGDGIHWGDQKYLDELVGNFNCVHVCKNLGAGIAPWNVCSYKVLEMRNEFLYRPANLQSKIFFYHYQSIVYINDHVVDVGLANTVDKTVCERLYRPYLLKIMDKKKYLAINYGIKEMIHSHPASHSRVKWLKESIFGHLLLYLRRRIQGRVMIKI